MQEIVTTLSSLGVCLRLFENRTYLKATYILYDDSLENTKAIVAVLKWVIKQPYCDLPAYIKKHLNRKELAAKNFVNEIQYRRR